MSRWLTKLTLDQKLGLVALALGAVAIFPLMPQNPSPEEQARREGC
jgi:hypothetical protein